MFKSVPGTGGYLRTGKGKGQATLPGGSQGHAGKAPIDCCEIDPPQEIDVEVNRFLHRIGDRTQIFPMNSKELNKGNNDAF